MKISESEKTIRRAVRKWLAGYGFRLKISSKEQFECLYREKLVKAKNNISDLKNLAILLHECGHVEQDICPIFAKKITYFPIKRRVKKTDHDGMYINLLEKEIDAWNRAGRIAQEIGFTDFKNIEEAIEEQKNIHVFSYIRFASRRGSWESLYDGEEVYGKKQKKKKNL